MRTVRPRHARARTLVGHWSFVLSRRLLKLRAVAGMTAYSPVMHWPILFDPEHTRADGDVVRLALWSEHGGARSDGPVLVRAAVRAMARSDHLLAERFGAAAVDVDGDGFEGFLVLGEAIAGQRCRADEAERYLRRAQDLAANDGDRVRAATSRARTLFFVARRPHEAMRVARAARDGLVNAADRAALEAVLAEFALLRGDLHAAAAAATRMRQQPGARAPAARSMLVTAACSQIQLGRFAEADESIRQGLGRTEDDPDDDHTSRLLHCHRALLDAFAGRLTVAEAAAREGFEVARRHRVELAGSWGEVLCQVLLLRGRPTEAGLVAAATERLADDGGASCGEMALACRAAAAGMRREEATVERLLERLAEYDSSDPRPGFLADLARTRQLAGRGELSAGACHAVATGLRAVADDHLVWGSLLLHEAVRLGRPRQALEPLRAVAADGPGMLIPTFARHAEALAQGDGHGLEEVAERFAGLGATLHAVEAAAQAAAGHRNSGRGRRARQAAARAEAWRTHCEGAWAPDLGAPTHGLTPREREIALLAAQGSTSPQVAEQLMVSSRTVDNHLRAVFAKLCVAGRTELADLLLP